MSQFLSALGLSATLCITIASHSASAQERDPWNTPGCFPMNNSQEMRCLDIDPAVKPGGIASHDKSIRFHKEGGGSVLVQLNPGEQDRVQPPGFFPTAGADECYVRCSAYVDISTNPGFKNLLIQDIGLAKISGYYTANLTCQPNDWPADAPIQSDALNTFCAQTFGNDVANVYRWSGSGDTIWWMLHAEPLIHLDP